MDKRLYRKNKAYKEWKEENKPVDQPKGTKKEIQAIIIADIESKSNESLFKGAEAVTNYFGVSGVYYLFKDKILVYIGESGCIFTRIAQHLKENVKDFDYFKVEPVYGEKQRKKREKHLIKKHRPILNYKHNHNVV